MFYNREGKEISPEEYGNLHTDRDYKIVKQETTKDGKWVSTVWLGINMAFNKSKPEIFETMVFPSKTNLMDEYCERYETEEEAIAGHKRIFNKFK